MLTFGRCPNCGDRIFLKAKKPYGDIVKYPFAERRFYRRFRCPVCGVGLGISPGTKLAIWVYVFLWMAYQLALKYSLYDLVDEERVIVDVIVFISLSLSCIGLAWVFGYSCIKPFEDE